MIRCNNCDVVIEVMDVYYTRIENNTDYPELQIQHFDTKECIKDYEEKR